MISIIIPTYNEQDNIKKTINNIIEHSGNGEYEIIVADGGSTDNTTSLAKAHQCIVIHSQKGRGQQQNSGAETAKGDILLFLHADTLLPDNFIKLIEDALQDIPAYHEWGRFDVELSGKHFLFRIIERMMTLRSKITGIATGDQAIFVNHKLFKRLSGFKNIPLMEDIELTRRLKKASTPACLTERVVTSSRRWELGGIVKTILLMWTLRFLFFMRVSPKILSKLY